MKRFLFLTVTIISLFAALNGCSVEKLDPPSTTPLTISPAVITTSAQGAAAASVVLQSKELVVTSLKMFKNLGFMAQSLMVSGATGTSSGTSACADYGSYTYTSTYIGSNSSYDVTFTFSLCRQNGFQYDGTYQAIGTAADFTATMAGLRMMNFHNNYKTLIGSLVGGNLKYTMQGAGDQSNAAYTMTVSGGMQAFDYYTLGQHTMNFSNFVANYDVSTNSSTNVQTSTVLANGQYVVKTTQKSTTVIYSDFQVDTQTQLFTNIEDVSMAGRISALYVPASSLAGYLDIATTTPIRTVLTPFPPRTTQGTFTINSAATAQYGVNDTLSVSVAGDVPQSYAKEFILMKQNDFYAMEQQLPIVDDLMGQATGNVMSISALSTGPTTSSLNCYTDVHVSYFISTAPTATNPDWYVHWASGLSTCVPQAGIPYQEATSSTGVATDPCDVGLDINGADQDITSGGVEHFLAASMPTGYYILSINNYSCTTTVENTATVMIGDYLFGPYTCTYTTSDGDGASPGAWCRLADVRVNADGTIDVLAPNASLNPWHP